MYEPKLPVTGYPFMILAISPLLSISTNVLLFCTFGIVLFRFGRLLSRENKLIYFTSNIVLILTLLLSYDTISQAFEPSMLNKPKSNQTQQNNHTNSINKNKATITDSKNIKTTLKENDYIGELNINSIALTLNVVEGETDKNMYKGAAHVSGTPYPWENGNCFIASHNVKNHGILFNRLKDVRKGDIITLDTENEHIKYKVYDIAVVEPNDKNCFKRLNGTRNLSLVTCFKDKRLIVYAKEINIKKL